MDSIKETIKDSVNAVLSKKILFVLTSADKFIQGAQKGKPTGSYLPELAHPYYTFLEAGYSITLSSPAGGKAPIDPSSVTAFSEDAECKRFLADATAQDSLEHTQELISINNITSFAAVFYVGGHGPCFDIATDVNSLDLLRKCVAMGKPVGLVCHAPVALIHLRVPPTTTGATHVQSQDEGEYFVKGKKVTCFTDAEEESAGLTDSVPVLVEKRLRELGARFESAKEQWGEHVVRDGLLVTGQNPASAAKTARVLIEAIEGQ